MGIILNVLSVVYKVKNKILDYLETNEITSINTLATGSVIKDFENYIDSVLSLNLNNLNKMKKANYAKYKEFEI